MDTTQHDGVSFVPTVRGAKNTPSWLDSIMCEYAAAWGDASTIWLFTLSLVPISCTLCSFKIGRWGTEEKL